MLLNLLATEGASNGGGTMWIFLGIIVLLFIVMGVVNSRQRKKQMAEDQKRKDSLCVGTKVITIGGIVGKVVSVDHKKSTFVLETEGTKINFDKRAIYQMELPESAKKEVLEPVEEVKEVEPKQEEAKVEVKKPTAKKTATKKTTAKPKTEEKVEEKPQEVKEENKEEKDA